MKQILAFLCVVNLAACSKKSQDSVSDATLASAKVQDDKKTVEILMKIEELASDVVGNGSVTLKESSNETIDVGRVVNEFKEHYKDYGKCKFKMVVGRDENLKLMKKEVDYGNEKIQSLLEDLHKNGKIKTIIAAHWDGKSGDGVSCSVFDFNIYTTGNHLLNLDYELTD